MLFFALDVSLSDQAFVLSLFQDYRNMMYRIALNVVNNQAAAEDLVQDAFLKVIQRIEAIRTIPESKQKAYLASMVRNASINYAMRENRCESLITPDELDFANDRETPLGHVLRLAETAALVSALRTLPLRDQAMLSMRYYEEQSDEAIAEAFRIKLVTVRSCLSRARQRLKKRLEEGDCHEQQA